MASIRKRGETFTITCYMGYDENGKQRKKTTTYRPPEGVTPGKAEKLAKQYAATWEDKVKGYVSLDENRTFYDLAEWFYENIAPQTLKPNVRIDHKSMVYAYVMPTLARVKLKDITPVMLDTLFQNMATNGRVKDTYRLKDGQELPKGKSNSRFTGHLSISEISRQTNLSRHTLQRLSCGHGIEKETAQAIADFLKVRFSDMFESDIEDRSLKANSVSRIKRCLSSIFTAAVHKEIMRRNPVSNTVLIKHEPAATSWLDERQAMRLIQALDEQPDFQFKVMINTLLFTGMRGGELCGLQWKDIDFEHAVIYIRHTLAYIRNVGQPRGQRKDTHGNASVYELQSTKTRSSERYVAVPVSLLDLLKQHKQRQDEYRAQCGDAWIDNDMVFTGAFGKYFAEPLLNKKFKAIVGKLGFSDELHIHSLRHTTASLLINADVPAKVIAEQLGHASAQITQDIYSHIFASSRARAAQALDIALKPKTD